MPEISRFYGIVIAMFFSEHNPPHFHARYGNYKAAIRIDELTMSEGKLPPRVLGLVVEWAAKHQEELIQDWERARNEQTLNKIEPLE
jgi:phosphomannomutase